ncbi:MAG: hypothetical protein ACUVUE_04765 [Candidatus Bathycorpusculaceae bacterium]
MELFAYILLACAEELDLSKSYGESFQNYRRQVPFLVPFFKTNREGLDVVFSILIQAILLFGLVVGIQRKEDF